MPICFPAGFIQERNWHNFFTSSLSFHNSKSFNPAHPSNCATAENAHRFRWNVSFLWLLPLILSQSCISSLNLIQEFVTPFLFSWSIGYELNILTLWSISSWALQVMHSVKQKMLSCTKCVVMSLSFPPLYFSWISHNVLSSLLSILSHHKPPVFVSLYRTVRKKSLGVHLSNT